MAPKRPLLAPISANQVRRKKLTPFERGQIAALDKVGVGPADSAKIL